jgi:L-alanine-DL-glutamate epimerase-like enolase superfamily enzyme
LIMVLHEIITNEKIKTDHASVNVYEIPTSLPESDGTIKWKSTTLIVVELEAGGKRGIGYTYGHRAVASVADSLLTNIVSGKNVMDIPALSDNLISAIRNDGNCGVAMMAVSAIDVALWDLKAKLLDVPLCSLLGQAHEKILIYGSGGFTSYDGEQLQQQLRGWANEGINYFKIKIGRNSDQDVDRVKLAREAIGNDRKLFVDANGAYTVKQAIEQSYHFAEQNISWFEEPVRSDNLKGLFFIRSQVQPRVNIAAGEYGYNLNYFRTMLEQNSVDVLQADATRCGGITGFIKAANVAEAFSIPFSSHCAPALHLHASLSLKNFYITEYFHDHVWIESMLFDGFAGHENGFMKPDLTRPGIGLEFKYRDAEQFKI